MQLSKLSLWFHVGEFKLCERNKKANSRIGFPFHFFFSRFQGFVCDRRKSLEFGNCFMKRMSRTRSRISVHGGEQKRGEKFHCMFSRNTFSLMKFPCLSVCRSLKKNKLPKRLKVSLAAHTHFSAVKHLYKQ